MWTTTHLTAVAAAITIGLLVAAVYVHRWKAPYTRAAPTRSPAAVARRRTLLEIEMVRLGWGQDNPAYRQAFTTMLYPGASPDQTDWFNELQRISATPKVAASIMEASLDIDVRDVAPGVTTPTLVLHPTDDAQGAVCGGRQLASLIPGARFVPLDSPNHMPLHEPAWHRFVDEIYAFTGEARD